MSTGRLGLLREQYPVGSRIRLGEMRDDPCPVEPGTMGTLKYIDDAGNLGVAWDNGRALSLVPGVDSFTVLPPLQTLKLYMPMTADLFERDEYGEWRDRPVTLSAREAVEYAPQIIAALQKERTWMEDVPEEAERGLMAYYDKQDSVNEKVRSYHFTAEVREGRLWGVAECAVQGELTPEETHLLMNDVGGQAADGLGESIEQHEIMLGGLALFAHLWQSEGWTIMTERDRFDPRFSERLPDMCWSVLPDSGSLIRIKRGENGYVLDENSCDEPRQNRHIADFFNKERGISAAQETAMLHGCRFGWDSPAADPKQYLQDQQQMGGPALG